jgi:hypothetical protein
MRLIFPLLPKEITSKSKGDELAFAEFTEVI